MLRAAVLSLMMGTAALPASAGPKDAPREEITGSWTFVARVEQGCTFTGVAYLMPTEDANTYGCELTATQECGDMLRYTVRQSCSARRTGDQLAIRSQIEEFIEGDPTPYYYPDNFTLSIKSTNRMIGALISSSSYSAEFIRSDEGVS